MSTPTTEPQNQVSLPKSISLGGVVYNVADTPELQNFIAQVGQVEKAKVRTTIDTLKQGIEDLRRVNLAPNGASNTDLETFKAGLLTEVKAAIAETVGPITQQLNQQRTETISDYRQRLIDANVNTCIPELVTGNSKEELDAALANSIALRARYSPNVPQPPGGRQTNVPQHVVDAANQAQDAALTPGAVIPQAPAPVVVADAQQPQRIIGAPQIGPITETPVNVAAMSHEEFARKRGDLEAHLKTLVPQQ